MKEFSYKFNLLHRYTDVILTAELQLILYQCGYAEDLK